MNDPATIEQRLRDSIQDWGTYTRGQIIGWMFRMKCLPREARHRLWQHLGRNLPPESMKQFRDLYEKTIDPDRRRE